ncbi:hypothetical protein [uncultured Chryseobacterium sp.]|uniref:hypothetical protein n=1 Tax=uncultured Chryseobacterium sp. TaxID=259322 RepID=UPI00258C135A|nr:hypothetical protein [uncultured Chryseobacterium sp.]
MNEEILTYNTPSSEKILRQINEYEFNRQWKNNLKKNNKNLSWGILFTILGVITIIFENYTFAGFFLGFSVAVISTYFNYLTQYKKYKKAFYEKLDREISNLEGNSKDVFLEFNPSHFSFKNYKSEYKFIWNEITYCILDDRYLYITANSSMNFILDKANVDKENLDKTLLYLEMKAKFKKI